MFWAIIFKAIYPEITLSACGKNIADCPRNIKLTVRNTLLLDIASMYSKNSWNELTESCLIASSCKGLFTSLQAEGKARPKYVPKMSTLEVLLSSPLRRAKVVVKSWQLQSCCTVSHLRDILKCMHQEQKIWKIVLFQNFFCMKI